jgi:hypothetical protein
MLIGIVTINDGGYEWTGRATGFANTNPVISRRSKKEFVFRKSVRREESDLVVRTIEVFSQSKLDTAAVIDPCPR